MIGDAQTVLKAQQKAAQRAYDRMMTTLLSYDATQRLTISDAKFIAEMARAYAFDACKDMDEE